VNALRAATGARVVGAAPFIAHGDRQAGLDSSHDRGYLPGAILADGERFEGAGFTIEAIATPGHCSNHLSFALLEENALLSGDHVMAWSTSVVAPPDGSMRAYMDSLEKLRARPETVYWPGHGGPVVDPQRYLRALIHHRRQREASILNALEGGPQTIPAIVAKVYAGLNPALSHAAGLSTLAHLEDFSERGMVVREAEEGAEPRFRLG
jgi:glyoxylase-like metal-dependent hydrolase (beta-lactamase superfamily II)